MSEWMKRIIESKRAMRRELAALPFAEKVRFLEQLRDRARLIKKFQPRSASKAFSSPIGG